VTTAVSSFFRLFRLFRLVSTPPASLPGERCWLRLLFIAALALPSAGQAQLPAGHNVFFVDLDQDSYGDPSRGYLFKSSTPPNRLWSPWGNDPDDNNPLAYPLPLPKGQRLIAQQLDPAGTDLPARLLAARELGAQTLLVTLRWRDLEPTSGAYSDAVLQSLSRLATHLAPTRLSLVLSLDVIDGGGLTMPADLAARVDADPQELGRPATAARAAAALGRVHAALGSRAVTALRLGNDVDLLQPTRTPAFWTAYAQFIRQTRLHARAVWGQTLPVGISGTMLGTLREPGRSLLQDLHREGDWMMVRFAPAEADMLDPRKTRAMVEYLVAAAQGKGIALLPIAFPSAQEVGSSEVLQSQFFRAFFEAWDIYAAQIPLVAVSALDDVGNATTIAGSYGFRQAQGAQKASHGALRQLSFERGWWELPTPASRKFHMGFTLTPYDTPPDPAEQTQVAHYTDAKVAQHGDLIALHMDGSVPWFEALLDPFTSVEPPYPGSVIGTWRNYRERLQPGKKVLVSINPLGIPRSTLAPAWGYGEGFSYTTDFQRQGNGAIADGENRLPPAPFDRLSFDAQEVKWAYLKYVLRTLDYFKPDYLCFAIEVSATDVEDAAAFQRYVELHRFIFEQLKQRPELRNTKLFVSFSATSFMTDEFGHMIESSTEETGAAYKYDEMQPGVRERLRQGLASLVPYIDLVGLSYYPHYGKYNAYTQPPVSFRSMMQFMRDAGVPDTMPLAITESGYSGTPFLIDSWLFAADPDKQQRHLELLLYELSAIPNPVEFVVNYTVRDIQQHWQRLLEKAENPRFVEFYKYFRNLGLYDENGIARPALSTWTRYYDLPLVP
jgi:hypothetical protein